MNFKIRIHDDVDDYLLRLLDDERKRCYLKFVQLRMNPFRSRAGCDLKKLVSRKTEYRLRVGNHRFFYTISDNIIWIEVAFRKMREY